MLTTAFLFPNKVWHNEQAKHMQLDHSRILLLGASGGIGQAIAHLLDKQGAHLLLVGRNEATLNSLKRSLSGEHDVIVANLNSTAGREGIVSRCEDKDLDLFINAAGVLDFGFYEQQETESIEQILSTNLVSPILLCHQLIPLLKQKKEAAIINVGSIFGSIGHPGFTTYCASKFGLRGFTEALQRELADTTIKVLYLAPRATKTGLNSDTVVALNAALGNTMDSPDEVAQNLLDMLSSKQIQRFMGWPEKLFVRVNGLFPQIVHKALVKKLPIIRQHTENR